MFGLMTKRACEARIARRDECRRAAEQRYREQIKALEADRDGWRFLAYSLTGANAGEGDAGVGSVEDGDAEHTPKARRMREKAARDEAVLAGERAE